MMMDEESSNLPNSLEEFIVESLPEPDRELLRRGALLRYVTPDLARAATGTSEDAKRLFEHPLLKSATWGSDTSIREIPVALRRALLAGWQKNVAPVLRNVADFDLGDDRSHHGLYARLANPDDFAAALNTLESQFDKQLQRSNPDVGAAHDLLRLLDEWPINQQSAAIQFRDQLTPRLNQYARTARDHEATAKYLTRAFEERALQLLWDDSPQWMLQIHAPGGRGKTMFLRNLLGRIFPRENIPAARIDFDYVSHLAIATTQPWRLLLAIARQLDAQLPHAPFQFMLESYGQFQAQLFSDVHPRRRVTGEFDDAWRSDSLATEASQVVPDKFRAQLADAWQDQKVLVVLDTVETVLHTHGAEIGPLLAALNEVRSGRNGGLGPRAAGLRVILCGRFDLEGTRRGADGATRARSAGFKETWVEPDGAVKTENVGDTQLHIGRAVISLELPGFSPTEARTYLERMWAIEDTALVDTIVQRCDNNPMKLALLAEHVKRSDLTAADVASFKSVELFYLVDRVVDRIADAKIQWLLRWGVLSYVLTRPFVDAVLWPALEAFAASRCDYDNPDKDDLPPSRHEVSRWKIPDIEAIRAAGAAHAAWDGLLDYAADASWVSIANDLPDAVVFHPEVRDPLRRLLREGGHPAYDNIHFRSMNYWKEQVEQLQGAARAVALRCLMFHAYQPWKGDRPDTSRLVRDSLQRFAADRMARREIAAVVLEAASVEAQDAIRPAPDDVAIAHLELAEFLVHNSATSGIPVDESKLDEHLESIEPGLSQGRRFQFLRAVLVEHGDSGAGWDALGSALSHPPPDEHGDQHRHLDLIVRWASARTPPPTGLEVARKLADEARGTRLEAPAALPLARGLLAAESWTAALAAAQTSGSNELEARALLGLGYAGRVLSGDYPVLLRAEASLLRYDPDAAGKFIRSEPPSPATQLLEARLCLLQDQPHEALSWWSSAADCADHLVAAEATLEMSRLLIDRGEFGSAFAELQRIPDSPLVPALRAAGLKAVAMAKEGDRTYTVADLEDVRRRVLAEPTIPPSVLVDIELQRLEIVGPDRVGLDDLADAVEKVDAPGSRLLALRGLWRVDAISATSFSSQIAGRLRLLTEPDCDLAGEPALAIARAELERATRSAEAGRAILEKLLDKFDRQEIRKVAAERLQRFRGPGPLRGGGKSGVERIIAHEPEVREPGRSRGGRTQDWLDLFLGERSAASRSAADRPDMHEYEPEPEPITSDISLEISSRGNDIQVKYQLRPSDAEEFSGRGVLKDMQRSHFRLAEDATSLLEDLGRTLMVDYLQEDLSVGGGVLELEIRDELAARLPWELSTYHGSPLITYLNVTGIVRRVRSRSAAPAAASLVGVRDVCVAVSVERNDRGTVREVITEVYKSAGFEVSIPPSAINPDSPLALQPETRALHIVTEIARRRSSAAIHLAGEIVTARNLAVSLDDEQPRLVVLDLVLDHSDYDAAEQLMLANSFCWNLLQTSPSLSVICGVFGAANQRIPQLQALAKALAEGRELVETAGLLQTFQPHMPLAQVNPLRSAVSASSATPRQRFRLGGERATLDNLATIAYTRGDYDAALGYLEQSLQIQRQIGDKAGEGTTLNNLAITAHARGDYDGALGYLEQSLKITRQIGHMKGEATTLDNIGQIYQARGDYEAALGYLEQSLQIQRQIGDKKGEATTLNIIGRIYATRGDFDAALGYLDQSLKMTRHIGDKAGSIPALLNMASIVFETRDVERALDYWGEALQAALETRDAWGIFHGAGALGIVRGQMGDKQQATELLTMAVQVGREAGFPNVVELEKRLQSLQQD